MCNVFFIGLRVVLLMNLNELWMVALLQVSTTMKDLCHDVFGVAKEKKDPKEVKTNRGISLF